MSYLQKHILNALVLTGIVALMLALVGCASLGQVPYQGPMGMEPILGVETTRRIDSITNPMRPRWFTERMGTVSNPGNVDMYVDIECDWTLVQGLYVPPRTTQYFHVDRGDRVCKITGYRSR